MAHGLKPNAHGSCGGAATSCGAADAAARQRQAPSQLEEVGMDGRQVVCGGAELGYRRAQRQHAALGRAQRQAVRLHRAAQRHDCQGRGAARGRHEEAEPVETCATGRLRGVSLAARSRHKHGRVSGARAAASLHPLVPLPLPPASSTKQLQRELEQGPRTFLRRHAHLALGAGGQEAAGSLHKFAVALLRVAGARLGVPAQPGPAWAAH